jgi:tRNA-specific 2-thiouridylase
MYHTIGQRQGLGIGGLKDASDEPWYVLHKDLTRNVLVVGQGNEHPGCSPAPCSPRTSSGSTRST